MKTTLIEDWIEWSQFTYNSHLAIGYGIYKFGDPKAGDKFQTSEDLKSQFALAAAKRKSKGVCYIVRSI